MDTAWSKTWHDDRWLTLQWATDKTMNERQYLQKFKRGNLSSCIYCSTLKGYSLQLNIVSLEKYLKGQSPTKILPF